eukprot:5323400-Amphidinium_carterae.1
MLYIFALTHAFLYFPMPVHFGCDFKQAGEWRRALLRYQHIIRTLSYLEHWEDAEARKAAVTLRRVAHLNAAMCLLKLEAWTDSHSDPGTNPVASSWGPITFRTKMSTL